jgi:heme-degrading monooxygenase HmoA
MAAIIISSLLGAGLVLRAPPCTMSAAAPVAAPPLAAERYVATNRFRVKDGREAAFEKRWADRKSKLGLLDGFRFFCMMRRVDREGTTYEDDINYISCTVWEEQKYFDAWKAGDAFKEAHGGGTVGGIASMLVATAMNTKGKPKAAMWEGVLPVSMGAGASPPEGGWRQVEADGTTMLDGECFLAMNRFTVAPGSETAFEQRFAQRESKLEDYDGFKGFVLLRRDGADPDGFNYSTWSVWRDRAAFDAWSSAQKKPAGPPKAASGGGAPPPGGGGPPGGGKPGAGGPPSIYVRPPVPAFYEGILMLESAQGV